MLFCVPYLPKFTCLFHKVQFNIIYDLIITIFHLTTACPTGEFQCTDGECIMETLTCDGENQCEDYSDESTICG